MASKYILQHTAEAIDHKLDLIVENKNLIEYPYDTEATGFPSEFIDSGDGSIIVPASSSGYADYSIQLATITLPAGTYTLSISGTNLDGQVSNGVSGNLSVAASLADQAICSASINSGVDPENVFSLSTESTVIISLYTGTIENLDHDVILRPQLEKDDTSTEWVPYMKDIGSYVDERFNGLNTQLRALLKANSTSADSITVGSTVLTEAQLIKILDFIDCIELES